MPSALMYAPSTTPRTVKGVSMPGPKATSRTPPGSTCRASAPVLVMYTSLGLRTVRSSGAPSVSNSSSKVMAR